MNVEKGNIKYQGDLFSINKKAVSTGKWFFATNRANLLTILASGIICPANCYAKYYDDLLSFSGNSIPLLRDGLYSDLTERVTGGNNARFPVLLEINSVSISELETDLVDPAGLVTR